MSAARRFWLSVLGLSVCSSALGLLAVSFLSASDPLGVGSAGHLAAAVAAVSALGVVVWQVASFGEPESDAGDLSRRRYG